MPPATRGGSAPLLPPAASSAEGSAAWRSFLARRARESGGPLGLHSFENKIPTDWDPYLQYGLGEVFSTGRDDRAVYRVLSPESTFYEKIHLVVKSFCVNDVLQNEVLFDQIYNEIVAHSYIKHKAIMPLLGVWEAGGRVHLAFQSGDAKLCGFRKFVREHSAADPEFIREIESEVLQPLMREAAPGILRIHRLGLIHGDIKPENFTIKLGIRRQKTRYRRTFPRLIDLGAVMPFNRPPREFTPSFMSPEVAAACSAAVLGPGPADGALPGYVLAPERMALVYGPEYDCRALGQTLAEIALGAKFYDEEDLSLGVFGGPRGSGNGNGSSNSDSAGSGGLGPAGPDSRASSGFPPAMPQIYEAVLLQAEATSINPYPWRLHPKWESLSWDLRQLIDGLTLVDTKLRWTMVKALNCRFVRQDMHRMRSTWSPPQEDYAPAPNVGTQMPLRISRPAAGYPGEQTNSSGSFLSQLQLTREASSQQAAAFVEQGPVHAEESGEEQEESGEEQEESGEEEWKDAAEGGGEEGEGSISGDDNTAEAAAAPPAPPNAQQEDTGLKVRRWLSREVARIWQCFGRTDLTLPRLRLRASSRYNPRKGRAASNTSMGEFRAPNKTSAKAIRIAGEAQYVAAVEADKKAREEAAARAAAAAAAAAEAARRRAYRPWWWRAVGGKKLSFTMSLEPSPAPPYVRPIMAGRQAAVGQQAAVGRQAAAGQQAAVGRESSCFVVVRLVSNSLGPLTLPLGKAAAADGPILSRKNSEVCAGGSNGDFSQEATESPRAAPVSRAWSAASDQVAPALQ